MGQCESGRYPLAISEIRNPRYQSLDMWRGFACLLVLLNHATICSRHDSEMTWADELGGVLVKISKRLWIGVPIFFVISGYCISATVDATRKKNSSVTAFFARRFTRIFPPYWVVLITSAILIGLIDYLLMPNAITETRTAGLARPWWYSPWQWIGNLTLTEVWLHYFVDHGRKGLFLDQAWTLCYEEQFYAVAGLLLLVCARHFFTGIALVTTMVGITLVVAPLIGIPVAGFFFDGLWIQFAIGVLVYYQLNYASRRGYWLGVGLLLCGGIYSCIDTASLYMEEKTWNQSYFAAFTFALMILTLRPFDTQLTAAAAFRPIRFCGTMCYSLYLVHVPVIAIARATMHYWGIPSDTANPLITMPGYCAISIGVSWGFYLLVERRFLNAKRL